LAPANSIEVEAAVCPGSTVTVGWRIDT